MTAPQRPPRRGPAAECDLVLKGGITSGVAYPGAIIALGRAFRLRNIGGTSAGAIASAVAAAVEFRRQRTGEEGFAEPLTELVDDLGTPGFTADLLHPTAATRPLMKMLLAGLQQGTSPLRRLLAIVGLLLRARAWWPALAFACAGGLAWLTIAAPGLAWWSTALLVAVLALFAAGVSIAGCAAMLARAALRSLGAPENGFAMCSGMPVRDGRPALTPWLHATIQRIAGLEPEQPLTFEDLEREGIVLALLTTDLSDGAPVSLPLAAPGAYWFDPDDVRRLLPAPAAAHLLEHSTEDYESALRMLPGKQLPVVMAVRMSLSVPLLISAIGLYGLDPHTGRPSREHRVWFTDGAVTSNFPITFFDAWVPGRPTFGLDLRPHPGRLSPRRAADRPPNEEMVVLPDRTGPPPLWHDVAGAGGFVRQLLDALMNWRDTAQSQLPGYRDRICQIRLAEDEGGLNLNMSDETIAALNERGKIAGTKLVERFDSDGRRQQAVARYLLLMRLLQGELRAADEKLDEVGAGLREGLRAMPGFEDSDVALRELAQVAAYWQQGRSGLDFESPPAPVPAAAMRVGPQL
ncbi:MAG TPA: patatin-like phospholipase family protein [Solirubrobacteraceae bacterium]|jgi:predicted acylesterase/phospholipase RssA|nr:patatin-like phospholipase family protein [Solirubrobacteraceae bacterium]